MSKAELAELILKLIPIKEIIKKVVKDKNMYSKIEEKHVAIMLMQMPVTSLRKLGQILGKELIKKKKINTTLYNRSPKRDVDGIVIIDNKYAIPWVARTKVKCNVTTKICKHKGKCKCLYKGGCGTLKKCPNNLMKKK